MSHLHLSTPISPLSLSRPLAPLPPLYLALPTSLAIGVTSRSHAALSSHRFRGRGTCSRPRQGASGLTGELCGETAVGCMVGWDAMVGAASGAQRWCIRSASSSSTRRVPRAGACARRTLGETAMEWKEMRTTLRRVCHISTSRTEGENRTVSPIRWIGSSSHSRAEGFPFSFFPTRSPSSEKPPTNHPVAQFQHRGFQHKGTPRLPFETPPPQLPS